MAFTPGMEQSMAVTVEAEGVDGFAGKIDNAVASLGGFKRAVGLAGATLATFSAGALASATSAAADFEEQMVEVEKVTDPATAEAMGESIRDMAREMPVAHKELSTIAATAGRLGVEGTDNIETFTENTAMMAEATDLSAEEAADSFARMSTLMEVPISKTEELGSAINLLSNNMAASSSEITNSATRSAGVLNQLGLEQESILGLNAAMNEVSASSRIAGTQLRRFGQEITDPAKVGDLASAIGMTEEEFRNLRDEDPEALMRRMVEAFQEGGEEAEMLRSTLGSTSRQTLSKLAQNWESVEEGTRMANDQFDEATSLQEEFDAATDTTNAQIQQLKNNLRDAGIAIGEQLLPYVNDFLDRLNDFLTSSDSVLNRLTAQQQAFGLVGTTIAGVAATLVWLVGGPITMAIGAVAALGAAYATNFMGMRDQTNRFVGILRDELMPVFLAFRDLGEFVVESLRTFWKNNQDQILADLRAFFGGLEVVGRAGLAHYREILMSALERGRTLWNQYGNDIIASVQLYLGLLYDVTSALLETAFLLWKTHGQDILTIISRYLNLVMDTVQGIVSALIPIVRMALERIREFWNQNGEQIMFIVESLANFVISIFKWYTNTALDLFKRYASVAADIWDRWGDEITTAIELYMDVVLGTISWALDYIETLIKAATAAVEGDWEEAWSYVAAFFERTLDGIVSFLEEWGVVETLQGIIDSLKGAVEDFGDWLIFESYIPDLFNEVISHLEGIDLLGPLQSALDTVQSGFEDTFGAIVDTVLSAKESIQEAVDTIQSAVSTAQDAVDSMPSPSRVRDRASSVRAAAGSVDVDVPQLAHGGIVTQPTLAMVGEGGESEAVIPLSKLEQMGGPRIENVEIHADSRAGGEAAADGFTRELRSQGFLG